MVYYVSTEAVRGRLLQLPCRVGVKIWVGKMIEKDRLIYFDRLLCSLGYINTVIYGMIV